MRPLRELRTVQDSTGRGGMVKMLLIFLAVCASLYAVVFTMVKIQYRRIQVKCHRIAGEWCPDCKPTEVDVRWD